MYLSDLSKEEYSSFFSTYINIPHDLELKDAFIKGENRFIELINTIPDDKLSYRYDEGKWTLAEVILHCIDTERVFQGRALRICRNDKTNLPGFEQDLLVAFSNANERSKNSLIEEYKVVRASTISLFSHLSDDVLKRKGIVSNNTISVRAIGFIINGHQLHHEKIISQRYLND